MCEDEIMKDLIISWGLPECLNKYKDNITFKFDNNDLFGTKEKNYHCKNEDVKFCLYNTKLKKVLFSMDFFRIDESFSKRFPVPRIQLELIYTHEYSLRKQGIATYYIEKLIEYAISRDIKCIVITANASAKNFENDNKINSLEQSELELFYKKRSTLEMPIEVLTLSN